MPAVPIGLWLASLSIPELASLAALVGVTAYLLLYWSAGVLFGGIIGGIADRIPIVGGALRSGINAITSGVSSWAGGWLDSTVGGLVTILLFIPQFLVAYIGAGVAAVEWVIGQLVNVGASLLQFGFSTSLQFVLIAAKFVEQTGILTSLAMGLGAANVFASYLYVTFIPQQIQAALATVTQWIATAVHNAELNLQGNIDALSRTVAQDYANAERNIANIEATLTNDVWPAIDGLTGNMDLLLPLALPVAFPLALSRILALETTLSGVMTECVNPMCNGLTPFLSMLSIMQDVATLAVIAALVESAVARPNETAHEIAGMADDLAGLGRGLAGAFTGLGL